MGWFTRGLVTGLANKLSDTIDEKNRQAAEMAQYERKGKVDAAMESYKNSLKRKSDIAALYENMKNGLPGATEEEIAQGGTQIMMGAKPETVFYNMEQAIRTRSQSMVDPAAPTTPLPGMGTPQDTMQAPPTVGTPQVNSPQPPQNLTDSAGFNIDKTRPEVFNKDGTISTESTITVGWDDRYYNIPTIINGKRVSHEEAKVAAEKNLAQYPSFPTMEEATRQAAIRSEDIEKSRQIKTPWEITSGPKSVFAPEIKAEDRQKTLAPIVDFVKMARESGNLDLVQEATDAQTAIATMPDETEARSVTRDTMTYLYNKAKGSNFNVFGYKQREQASELFKAAANDALSFKNPKAAKQLAMLSTRALDGSSNLNEVMLEGNEIIGTLKKPVDDTTSYSRLKDQLVALDTAKDLAVKQGDYARAIEIDKQKASMLSSGRVNQEAIGNVTSGTGKFYSEQLRQEAAQAAKRTIDPTFEVSPFTRGPDGQMMMESGKKIKADVEFESQAAAEIAFFALDKGIITGEDPRVVSSNVASLLVQDFGTVNMDTAGPGTSGSSDIKDIDPMWLGLLKNPEFTKAAPSAARFLNKAIADNYVNFAEAEKKRKAEAEKNKKKPK